MFVTAETHEYGMSLILLTCQTIYFFFTSANSVSPPHTHYYPNTIKITNFPIIHEIPPQKYTYILKY